MSSKRLGKGINAIINTASKEGANSYKQPGVDKVKINNIKPCLLYTSPSPRDRTRSRMPSSA